MGRVREEEENYIYVPSTKKMSPLWSFKKKKKVILCFSQEEDIHIMGLF